MAYLASLLRTEKRSRADYITKWLAGEDTEGYLTSTGIEITELTALQISAVFACVDLISSVAASLPLILYKRLPNGGKERATKHYLYPKLHLSPNKSMTSFDWKRLCFGHYLLWGNSFNYKSQNQMGQFTDFWPMRPDRMLKVERIDNRNKYTYLMANNEQKTFDQDEIIHIKDFSVDGIMGLSRIAQARESIGLSKALERCGAKLFQHGLRPSGTLEHPGQLYEEGHKNLDKSLKEQAAGENIHGILILEEGMTWKQSGIPPEDAQFLESRQFQKSDIASFYRVSSHMIGDTTKISSWGTGIEQMTIGFINYTERPYLIDFEQQLSLALLQPEEHQDYFIEFLIDALMRGDSAARSAFYREMLMNGVFSPNDVLEMENRNPYEGGDKHFVQLNMQTVENIGKKEIMPVVPKKDTIEPDEKKPEKKAINLEPIIRDGWSRLLRRSKNILERERKKLKKDAPDSEWEDIVFAHPAATESIQAEIMRPVIEMLEDKDIIYKLKELYSLEIVENAYIENDEWDIEQSEKNLTQKTIELLN